LIVPKIVFENIRRRSVRGLKLYRGSIIIKKGGINPLTNSATPPPSPLPPEEFLGVGGDF
jgi:hypothetical protein